jgi:hypothetical protein
MKTITLKKLTLDNWRAQSVVLEFKDGVNEIRARNGIGKSTLFNAWVWLICGTDTQDRANYDLYDTKHEQSKDTPAASVEAVLDVDGSEVILKRSAKSQWTRPRGREEWVKASSDKYTFYVDNVEYLAKQYQDHVSSIFAGQDNDMIKMMVNPLQNLNLEWKQLRKMFQRIIGEIKHSDYQGDYSAIEELIEKHGFDIAKQSVMNNVADLKKALKRVEDDLDAKRRTLPDLSQCDEAQRQIEQKKVEIAEIDKEITGIGDANKPFIEKRKAEDALIAQKLSELQGAKYQYELHCEDSVKPYLEEYRRVLQQIKEIDDFNHNLKQRRLDLEHDISSCEADVEYLTEARGDLVKRKDEARARQFVYNDVCPTCGQTLPYDEDEVNAARQRFNEAKEKEIEEIVTKGKKIRAQLDERQARLTELKAQRTDFTTKEQLDITPYETALNEAKKSVVAFEQTEQYKALNTEIEDLLANRTEIPETKDTSELQLHKNQLLEQLQTLSEITAYRGIHEKISRDIADKEVEQQATASRLAAEEHKLFKFVEYEREHASIVSTRVNQYLKIANVKMLTVNKSGEYVDCCVITCDTVGSTMNRASVIRTGVDVAAAFQHYFGLSAPMFVDDVDCIADELIPQTDSQQIRLRFDNNYPELTLL